MNDQQLLRYSRHILLNEIGIGGQERLLGGHALIIGLGGLGSLIGVDHGLSGKLLSVNALDMNIMRSTLARDPNCRVCGNAPTGTTTAELVGSPPPQLCRSGSCSC